MTGIEGWVRPCCLLLAMALGAQAQQSSAEVQANVRQGLEALEQANFVAAEKHFSRALATDPSLDEVRANLGLAYYADHKYAEAVEAFRVALKHKASLRSAHTFLPLSLAALNQCEEAVPGLRQEFSSNPDLKLRRVIGLSLERCLFQSGKQAEADQVTQQLLTQYPEDVDVLYEAGQLYAKLSSQIYLRLTKLAPHSGRGYQVMGQVAASEGNWQQAVDAYRQALALNPALPGVHLDLAVQLLLHSHDSEAWKEALEHLNTELKINPSSAEAYYEIGEVYRRQNQPEQAIAAFREALRLDPGFVEPRLELAKVFHEQKRAQEALAVLEPARQPASENAAVHFLLMQLYRELGRTAEAEREEAAFKRLQSSSPLH